MIKGYPETVQELLESKIYWHYERNKCAYLIGQKKDEQCSRQAAYDIGGNYAGNTDRALYCKQHAKILAR